MKRHALRQGLVLGALGVSLLAGCNVIAGRPSSGCCGPTPAVQVCSTSQPFPASCYPGCGTVARTPVSAPMPPLVRLGDPVHNDTAPHGPVATLGFQELPDSAAPPTVQLTVPLDAPIPQPRDEREPTRNNFVDLSAVPCFSHAPDYNWIIGQVEYSRIAKEWRLRYTSLDNVDQHGGRVILIENHHVTLLRDSQYVHVRGHLVNSPSDDGPMHYRIESFRVLENTEVPPAPPDAK